MLVAIGDNCIDRYLPPIALEFVGGNAVNVAANLATHGCHAAYAGMVGTDAQGTRILKSLQAIGVNTDFVMRNSQPTGFTDIEVQGGDYAILRECYGASDHIEITDALQHFLSTNASRIHLTVTGKATALIENLHTLRMPISVDLGIVRSVQDFGRFEQLLPHISEAFFSAGSGLSDSILGAALEKAVQLGARAAIATRGERGCTALRNGRTFVMESQVAPEDIVDPLGAGDAFIAGYLSAMDGQSRDRTSDESDMLLTASTWAAQACKHIGGWPGAGA